MKIIFMGCQGSGKSTQAQMFAQKFNLPYVEIGQLLRDRSQRSDPLARRVKEALDSGHLVEDQITINILAEKLKSVDFKNGYILDGFPRNLRQYSALEKDIDFVLYIKVQDQEAIRRLLLRKRSDDTSEALKRRLEIYHRQTEPLLEKFKNKKKLIEINGEQSIENVQQNTVAKLKEIGFLKNV